MGSFVDRIPAWVRNPSLTVRVVALIVGLVSLVAVATSWLVVANLRERLIELEVTALDRRSSLPADTFVKRIESLIHDTCVLARMPPIAGLVRAEFAGGVDPRDGSTAADWKQRLETIFTQVLKHTPQYLQLRYIGVADGGKELVRVDRARPGADIRVVRADALQRKGDRPYVKAGLATSPEGYHLSKIELNQEHGRIQEPWVPVIRCCVRVDSEKGAFGVVVVNFALDVLFEELDDLMSGERSLFIATDAGAYVHHPAPGRAFSGEATAFADHPILRKAFADKSKDSQVIVGDEDIVCARRVSFGGQNDAESVALVTSAPIEVAVTAQRQAFARTAWIVLACIVLATLVGIWLTQRITRPIGQLVAALRSTSASGARFNMPMEVVGEAETLAAALLGRLESRSGQLELANRQLERFAYVAAHDLQEPVRTIKSFAELIDKQRERLGETEQRGLDFILSASDRMQDLIRDLLDHGRIGREPAPEPVDVHKLVDDVCEDLSQVIQSSAGEVVCGSMPTITAFPSAMRLLFQNLIDNALKFRHPDRPPVVRITSERDGDGWRFRVADNGIGIEPAAREKVFGMFQRLHHREVIPGSGIGLAHCEKVVEIHQGRIWIEESDGGGATFCVFIKEVTDSDGTTAQRDPAGR